MKVLIVGSGGREHAIAHSVAKSEKVSKIYCAPGNAGISEYAECVAIGAMEFDKLVAFAKENAIDLVIVGMDDPLVGGLVDLFEAEEIRICFSNSDITNIIFPWLELPNKEYKHKEPKRMHVGQEALVFKLHITPSETQPIVQLENGVEAKKIQNIYVYCQYLTRVK